MSNDNKPDRKPLTERQMKVYEAGFNMVIKLILIIVGVVAFFMILLKLLNTDSTKMLLVYGGLEGLLGGTLFVVYRHYFPSK